MINMTKISIIIPVYNVEKYLHKCVDSVLGQTFTDFELILINDGSTDSSGDICDEYAKCDSRVVVIHKKNGGVSTARNTGLDAMKGEYVTFIDSDDYVSPYYLENFFCVGSDLKSLYIRQYAYNEAEDIIFSEPPRTAPDITIFTDDNFEANFIKYDYMSCCAPWAKLFSSSIIKKYKLLFPIGLNFNEDHYFVVSYITALIKENGLFAYIDTPQYHYMKRNNGSLSCKSRPVAEDCTIALMLSAAMSDCFEALKLKNKCYEDLVISIPWQRLMEAISHSKNRTDVEQIYQTIQKSKHIWGAHKLGSRFNTALKDILINTPQFCFSPVLSACKLVMNIRSMVYSIKK